MEKKGKVVFKEYAQRQMMLLPPTFDELIPATHSVRVVNHVIDRIDLGPLLKVYSGGGASTYHPRMMLKVLVYAYLSNIYSSRRMESALCENIHFMWLSGMARPDHNTINRFRSHRLKDVMKQVFSEVVLMLMEAGHVDLKAVYTDGTKIESTANRYTFVWAKTISTNREKMRKQLDELWAYTQEVAKEELADEQPPDLKEMDPEKVEQAIDRINEALKGKDVDAKKKQKLNYARKNWPVKLKEYAEKERILNGRGSYAKTDPDATFMRMKDDHMGNGQLKPGYNVQWSTQYRYVVNYSLHPDPNDTLTLPAHVGQFEEQYGQVPESVVADAGYGSEQNYELLQEKDITAYVKYNMFHREQQKGWQQKNPFHTSMLHYDRESDRYICPMGQPMRHIGDVRKENRAGHVSTVSRYRAQNCSGCPMRGVCFKAAEDHRVIEVNHRLNELKAKARELLTSEEGLHHRSQRPVEVESAFGNLKRNMGFTRFMLRGLDKVSIETGLLATAMNLRKLAMAMAEQAKKAANTALYGIEERLYALLGPTETRLSIILNA
jgi:transposase